MANHYYLLVSISPCTVMVSLRAVSVNPSWHITIAPLRSLDTLAVIVEVRGDVDMRSKEYVVALLVVRSLLLPIIISLEKYR